MSVFFSGEKMSVCAGTIGAASNEKGRAPNEMFIFVIDWVFCMLVDLDAIKCNVQQLDK